jgi:hypothetical protein
VFNRISKKVIGILFAGITEEYGVCYNYEGFGEHKVKALQATPQQIKVLGKEKCQKLNKIKLPSKLKIAQIAQAGREKRIKKSNQRAIETEEFTSDIDHMCNRDAYLGPFLLNLLPFSPFSEMRKKMIKRADEEVRIRIDNIRNIKRIEKDLDNKVNYLEAYYLNAFEKNGKFSQENKTLEYKISCAQNLSAYYCLIYAQEDVLSAKHSYDNRFEEVNRLMEIENSFESKFSPKIICNR